MRLAMTLKVRDEVDVIEHNLRYHHAQGVDLFVVTDNGSTDGTLDVLRRYRDAGLVHLFEEPGDDFRKVARGWVTRMARTAATEHGADWVINTDADEFWWPIAGSLKDVFGAIPSGYSVLFAPRPEFAARPDGPAPFYERLTVREARSRLRPKAAHRGRPDIHVGRGSHYIQTAAEREGSAGSRHSSRAVLRTVSPEVGGEDGALVPAPSWPVRILHFPVRSFEQYRRRMEVTLYHGGYGDDRRRRELREHFEQGRMRELYDRLVLDDAAVEVGLREGTLVEDHSLRDFMPGCPDPLDGGAAQAPAPPAHLTGDQLDADLAANAYDVMHALDRNERQMRRRRKRANRRLESLRDGNRELRREAARARRERDRLAARLDQGPVARARAAAGRLLGRRH